MVSARREFDSRSQIHSGVVQLAERGIRNAVTGVRFSAPDPFFLARARRRAWSSGRASAFQADDVSSTLTVRSSFQRAAPGVWPDRSAFLEHRVAPGCVARWVVDKRSSFSGRISRCHREDTGSNPVDRSKLSLGGEGCRKRVRGASSTGELWSCKPAMRVRFPRIPPGLFSEVMLALAERLRRLPVEQSRRVQLPCVNPKFVLSNAVRSRRRSSG